MLLVYGLLATGEMFGQVLDAFARHHTVIVPDLRGYVEDVERWFKKPGPAHS